MFHGHGSFFYAKTCETVVSNWKMGKITHDDKSIFIIDEKGQFLNKKVFWKSEVLEVLMKANREKI